jgi:CheY-like chemotaxis protein
MAAKIMLVEDDTNLSEIYKARLEAEGYQISSAKDGEEALAMAVKEHPDLIISDIMMPNISGFDMLDILRSTPGIETTKVVMMTALGQAEDKSRAEKLGADRYLVKSQVTLEDVVKVVHEVLGSDKPGGYNKAQADISATVPKPPTPYSTATTPVTTTPISQLVNPVTAVAGQVVTSSPPISPPPVAAPAPSTASNQPLLVNKPPVLTATPTPDKKLPIDPELTQSSKDETLNIDSQIQDFLKPTPAEVTPASPPSATAKPVVTPQPPISPSPVTAPSTTDQKPENSYVNIPGKKTIPTDFMNNRPDIYSLLAKEEGSLPNQAPNQSVDSSNNNIDPNGIAL